jgi:hypothetical protein
LGVKANPSESAFQSRPIQTPPCKTGKLSVFSTPGQRGYEQNLGPANAPQVTSLAADCSNPSRETVAYRTFTTAMSSLYGAGDSVPGVGNGAEIYNVGRIAKVPTQVSGQTELILRGKGSVPAARSYLVLWRADDQIDTVIVTGPSGDKRITPALAELLARRAAASS